MHSRRGGMPVLDVQTEQTYRLPQYFLINGRSMPDLMDPNYAGEYPHQPYNGNPHMPSGEYDVDTFTIGPGVMAARRSGGSTPTVRIFARDIPSLGLSSTCTARQLYVGS